MTSPREWRLRAACRGHEDMDLWHPVTSSSPGIAEAKRICRGCPVRVECGEDAADHDVRSGIAAAFNTGSTKERRLLHVWLGRTPPVDGHHIIRCECGTDVAVSPGHTRCSPCEKGLRRAAPVAAHIDRLAKTMTIREIAQRAGVPVSTVYVIRQRTHIRRDTAQRILAVEVVS